MDRIDFIELAQYCVSVFKEEHNSSSNHYVRTLYASISEDNQVKCSITPHVLEMASKCILVHEHSELAVSNFYRWYKVQYIDENGCVFDGNLGGGYTLKVYPYGSYSNMWMGFRLNNTELYSCEPPFEDKMAKIWALYLKLKDIKSEKEVKLLADLFRKDERIFELEKEVDGFKYEKHLLELERDQYRDMLDEIKEVLKTK